LPSLKPTAQLRRGVTHILEAKTHLLVGVIPRFIQRIEPLPPLKLMAQSRCGVIQILEV
jgi:hypothetical protein